jgi:biotin operon repressor BirA-like protein
MTKTTGTTTDTPARLLQLLSLLQTPREWPGGELSERLGVSRRTVRRDIDRLRDLGYPVEAHRGVAGGYRLAAGAALPPLVVDDEEAVALAVGLRMAAQGAVAGIDESAIRALAKVVQVMPPRLRRRVDALRAMTVPGAWRRNGEVVGADVLTTIAQACRDEERLRFSYRTREGGRGDRHVEPHRLVSLGTRWYLVAYDLTRHDWRSFRLDRLADPCGTRERFRPRELPAEDAAAFVRAGIQGAPVYDVEALVHAPAARVRGLAGHWASVEEVDDLRCRIRMTADDLAWPTFLLGVVGADFEIVTPPELAAHVREWGARFTRVTEPPGVSAD